jgi:hypothetical protein
MIMVDTCAGRQKATMIMGLGRRSGAGGGDYGRASASSWAAMRGTASPARRRRVAVDEWAGLGSAAQAGRASLDCQERRLIAESAMSTW